MIDGGAVDKAAYARDGYALVRSLVDAPTVAALRGEAMRFDGGRGLGVTVQLVHRSRIIREFVCNGPQVEFAKRLIGPNVCFTHQQFIVKHPDPRARTDVPWHQDNGYGRLEPPHDLTVWIVLDACTLDNGCLWVLPGSHTKGLRPHEPAGYLRAARVEEPGIPIPMHAGDALLFGGLLLHRSLPNTTKETRVALYLRYCDPHVTMVDVDKPVLDDAYSWMVAGEA